MTSYPFQPSLLGAFNFQPTFDGNTYIVTVTWNLYGQRYYVNCFTVSGDLVFSVALAGSANAQPIEAIAWTPNTVTVTTAAPHGYRIGSTVALTVAGMTPDAYNGTFDALIINANQFTYALSSDPGAASSFGAVSYDINLAAGYFTESTLVYRAFNQVFEVAP